MSAEGEMTPERKKGGDDVSWTEVNLTRSKNKKIYAVDLTATNGR
jgi:hypothetical protein